MTKIIDDNLFIHRILLCSFIMATTRSAIRFVSRRFSNGKVLSEEEKAAENVFIKVYPSWLRIFGSYFPFGDDDENVVAIASC